MATVLAFPEQPFDEGTLVARLFDLSLAGQCESDEFRELEAMAMRGLTRWCSSSDVVLPGTAHFWAR